MHAHNTPAANELCVARTLEAGGVLIGKTTTPEFGFGATCQNRLAGPTANPYDLTRTSGSSSGGSAVAVCTGMTAIAHGTDFGGSCRTATGIAAFPNDQSDVLLIDGKPLASIIDYIAPTATMSLFGLPALSIPCGWTNSATFGRPQNKRGRLLFDYSRCRSDLLHLVGTRIPARRAKASSEP